MAAGDLSDLCAGALAGVCEVMASKKSPVEIASDLGSKAHDLYQYGDHAACAALRVIAKVNPETLAWLRDRLLDITQQRPIPDRRSDAERQADGGW